MTHREKEIARLQNEYETAQAAFVKGMQDFGRGTVSIDEVCDLFRKSSSLQIDMHEQRLRIFGDMAETMGIKSALDQAGILNLSLIG